MEREIPFETSINRTTPEIPVRMTIGKEAIAVLLRYDNTLVVTHHEDYEQFDHVMIYDLSIAGEPIYMFRGNDGDFGLGEALMSHGFDNYDRVYPSVEDEERWVKWECRDLDGELDNI